LPCTLSLENVSATLRLPAPWLAMGTATVALAEDPRRALVPPGQRSGRRRGSGSGGGVVSESLAAILWRSCVTCTGPRYY
jgi:hypothetical protein